MPPRQRVERTKRVMVRLSNGGAPDEVLFSEKEYTAVEKTARACGTSIVSTFVRDVGLAAAKATVSPGEKWDNWQICKAAALACNMPLGQWLRDVALAGVHGSPQYEHMAAARLYVTWAEKRA